MLFGGGMTLRDKQSTWFLTRAVFINGRGINLMMISEPSMEKMMKKGAFLYLLFLPMVLNAFTPPEDVEWPNFRGHRHNFQVDTDGVVRENSIPVFEIVWKKPLGKGYSSVSVADGMVVTMFSDSVFDYVIALDANSGEERWRVEIDSTYRGHDGSTDGPISTPLIDGGNVYCLGPKGQLLDLELATGKRIWGQNLLEEHSAIAPFYGFTTSPLVHGDLLIVQTGGKNNNAISALQKSSGELVWTAGSDTVNYHSPMLTTIAGIEHLVYASDNYIYGLEPATGKTLWFYQHDGESWPAAAQGISPTVLDGSTLFFIDTRGSSKLIEIAKGANGFSAKEIWQSREIRSTFNQTIYKDGLLYGYSGAFLTAVDPGTGKRVWKSRPPGDGWLLNIGPDFIVLTKDGVLSGANISPEGYSELSSLQVFADVAWTPPSFAYGKIFARSLGEIASIDINAAPQQLVVETEPVADPRIIIEGSDFAAFVEKVSEASNKNELIGDFINKNPESPFLEGNKYAHIFYHGEAEDLAIRGDMLEIGQEIPMNRVPGTNFYYASFELPPDAHVSYQLTKNFDQLITDPLNPVKALDLAATEVSSLFMPKTALPAHLDEPKGEKGRLDSLTFESKILNNGRSVEVYLPSGYDASDERYPVVYVNYGRSAIRSGLMPNTLDNLIGRSVRPVIAVFVDSPRSFAEYSRQQRDQYAQMVVEELVPFIDRKYRTNPSPEDRAYVGGDEGGYAAFYAAFKYPGVFGNVAGQSTHLFPSEGDALKAILTDAKQNPINIYMDWGAYDHRSSRGNFSWQELNKSFAALLQEKGYTYAGGEVNDGFNWPSWRNRTDKIFETLFPLQSAGK
jgi:enterochelin esterase-like enzyme/outer membrane protein assembly factor BamB